jgi:hypothetical protein
MPSARVDCQRANRDNEFPPPDVDCHVTLPWGVMPIAMDGTIPRFNRVVCGYFTLGGQPQTCGNAQTSECVLMPASVQLHALPHCNSNGRFASISRHFAPVGALQRVTAKARHPHEIAHCRAEVLHDAANLAK